MDDERAPFFASTTMVVGNGQKALFWEDRWIDGCAVCEIAPRLYNCIPKRRRKIRIVAQGLQGNSWAQDIHGILGVHEAVPGARQAYLEVDWTDSGTYTAKSCYQAQFHGSTASSSWKLTWKTWAPPRVKFFCWLACMDRCLLCDQILETMHHLILACPFSRQVWHEVLARLRMTCQPPNDGDTSLDDWWRKARQLTPKPLRKGLDSITLLTPWLICKHCNSCVFDRARPSVRDLVKAIFDEALCGLELARKA
jgi:hypothetical protein